MMVKICCVNSNVIFDIAKVVVSCDTDVTSKTHFEIISYFNAY